MFLNLFETSSQIHDYNTRSVSSYRSFSNIMRFSILVQGPKTWNSLPAPITCSASLFTFERKLLEFLFKQSRIGQAALT